MSELRLPPKELTSTTSFNFMTPQHPHSRRMQRAFATIILILGPHCDYHDGRLSESQVGD
jgi:hypothetical protein